MADLQFNIKANYDQIEAARKEMNRLHDAMLEASKANNKMLTQDLLDQYNDQRQKIQELTSAASRYATVMSTDFSKRMQSVTREVYSFEMQADASARKLKNLRDEVAKMQGALLKGGLDAGTTTLYKQKISTGNDDINAEKARYDELKNRGEAARNELKNMQTEYIKYAGNTRGASAVTNEMTTALGKMISEMQNVPTVGQGASSLFQRLTGDAHALTVSLMGGLGFEQLAQHIFNTRSEFQQLEISFSTMLGSEQKAGALMDQLINTAAKTPFNMGSITQGAKQLLAYGTAANEVNDILVHLGDISAGLSVPLGDLVYLYGTTMAQGRMYTMDLRQFMGRGIPMAEELGKLMGKTTAEVQQAVTDGKVGADLVKKAIIGMSSEGGKFGGLMDKQSETLQGRWSNIEDSVEQMFNEMGKKSEGVFGKGLEFIGDLVANWQDVVRYIGAAAVALGTYKAGLMAAKTVQKAQNKATLSSITQDLDDKMKGLKGEEGDYREKNGKNRKEYKANRYSELSDVLSDTTNIGDDDTERIVSLKIEEAKNEGLITEEMAKQLQTKRDLLVAQQQAVDKEKLQYDNAQQAAKDEEERAAKEKADAEDIAVYNAQAEQKKREEELTQKIEKANNTDYGKAILKTHELEKQEALMQEVYDKSVDEATAKKAVVDALDAEIQKQEEIVRLKEESIVNDDSVVDTTSFGGYEDALSQNEDASFAEYDVEMAKLEELKQKRKEASDEYLDSYDKMKVAKEEHADVQERLNEAMDEETEAYKEMGAGAEEVEETVRQGIEIKEGNLTVTEACTQADNANTTSLNANATSKSANTTATGGNTTAKGTNTTATATNTTATNTNTTSEGTNTIATDANTGAEARNTLGTRILSGAKMMLKAAVDQVTNSFNALKIALMTNPLTAILTVVTTAISLFTMFGDSEEEAGEKTKEMGNKAQEASEKVRSLFAITAIGKAEEHKDAINELKAAYEEYGVKLDETKMKSESYAVQLKELQDHEHELIGVIEERTIAMERANQLQSAYDDYKTNNDNAYDAFKEDVGSGLSDADKGMIKGMISNEDIELMGKYAAEVEKYGYATGAGLEASNKFKEVQQQINDKIRMYLKEKGEEGKLTNGVIESINDYTRTLGNNNAELHNNIDETNKAADAAEKASRKASGLTDKQQMQAEVNRLSKKTFKELNEEVQETIKFASKKYHIDIKVNYDDSELPAWVKKMSNAQLARSIAVRDSFLKKNEGKKNAVLNINGKIETQQQAAQILAMLQARANNETNKQEKTAKELEKKRKAAEAARKKAEQAKNEADTRAGNTRNAKENYDKTISSYSEKAEEELQKRRTEMIKDAPEKEIEQINWSSDKEKKAIEDGIDKIVEARKKRDQAIWVNESKGRKASQWKQTKSDKEYRNEVEGTQMTDSEGKPTGVTIGQNAKDQIELIEQQRQLKIKKIQQAEMQDMLDFLKQYGSYEQQRYAIMKEYEGKIDIAKQSGNNIEAARLGEQRDSQLSKLNFDSFKDSINWDSVFQDMSRLSTSYLEDLRAKLKNLLGSGTLEIEDMKVVSDQINKIDDAIAENGNKWGIVNNALREHKRLLQEAKDAEDRLVVAQGNEATAKLENGAAQNDVADILSQGGINVDPKSIKVSDRGKFDTSKLTESQQKKLNAAFDKLAVTETKVAKSTQEVEKAQNEKNVADQKAKRTLQDIAAEWADALGGIADKLKDLPGLVSELGLENTGVGKAVNNGMDALNSGANAAKDFASGNYVGAALNGIKTVKSLGKVFGIGNGSNAKEVQESTDQLTEANERLKYSIDKLKDTIDSKSGMSAISDYQKAYEEQKKVNKNSMDILSTQMNYHGAHHSNAYYWNLSASDYAAINKTLKDQEASGKVYDTATVHSVNSLQDVFKLTPEQMADIRTWNEDVWKKMLDQGKYDKSEYWTQYTELSGQLEELTDKINQNLTQTSFDSMRSDFISNLMDMSKSASDFANDFTTMLNQSMLNFALDDLTTKKLKPLYEKWAKVMRDEKRNLTTDEIAQFKAEYAEITKEGMSIRDNIADVTGYKQSYEQSASKGVFESMSQDTGEELNGRFTAVQIATEGSFQVLQQINDKMDSVISFGGGDFLTANLTTLNANVSGMCTIADEGRTILAQSLMCLQSIDERQEEWHKPMLQAFRDISKMQQKIEYL